MGCPEDSTVVTETPFIQTEFVGVGFDQLDESTALDVCVHLARRPRFTYLVTPNVDHIIQLHAVTPSALSDLSQAYKRAAYRLCDSRILQLLARWSDVDLLVVPGSDLTAGLLRDPRLAGMRIALIGADSNSLAWLADARPDVSFVQIVPPMGVATKPAAQEAIVDFVERTDADIVLFALGAPQSELLCQRIASRGAVHGVGLCIGASIEFLTGAKRRAPPWIRRFRLEWAFRLASEPRRLWRRYLVQGPRIISIWRDWDQQRRNKS